MYRVRPFVAMVIRVQVEDGFFNRLAAARSGGEKMRRRGRINWAMIGGRTFSYSWKAYCKLQAIRERDSVRGCLEVRGEVYSSMPRGTAPWRRVEGQPGRFFRDIYPIVACLGKGDGYYYLANGKYPFGWR